MFFSSCLAQIFNNFCCYCFVSLPKNPAKDPARCCNLQFLSRDFTSYLNRLQLLQLALAEGLLDLHPEILGHLPPPGLLRPPRTLLAPRRQGCCSTRNASQCYVPGGDLCGLAASSAARAAGSCSSRLRRSLRSLLSITCPCFPGKISFTQLLESNGNQDRRCISSLEPLCDSPPQQQQQQ